MRRDRPNRIEDITKALITSGYISLDQQAKALGLPRSTVWTITKNKHKLGRLSRKTIERILANPDTPPSVRRVVRQYLSERSSSYIKNKLAGRYAD
jgi:hypothetical protein